MSGSGSPRVHSVQITSSMSSRTHATRRRLFSGVAGAGLIAGALVIPALTGATASAVGATPATSSCDLGHGISRVINIVFDNVHFGRDNPNVPSDLRRSALMNFMKEERHRAFSNTHTPMIAHTADDSLSIYTGLYGDRHGQPLSNSYKTYNPDGTTDPAASFAYWTSPVADTKSPPTAGHDTSPSMVYSDTVPASGAPTARLPLLGSRSRAPAATSVTSRPPTWWPRTPTSTSRRSSAPIHPR